MQTERLYYDYSVAAPVAANIIDIRPWKDGGKQVALVLSKTIFYPEGGGQPADRGRINTFPLLDVQETDGEILHIVSVDGSPPLAGPAELFLDAARRRDFTVQHTAQHLLSGTILRLTGKYTVSMHLGDETNTIDVDSPELSAETLAAVEDKVAAAIETDCPLLIHRCPPENVQDFPLRKTPPQGEEVIRVVEIQGHDFSPCCGTHCASTGQIGALRVLGAEKYKGMTRVSFIAGRRVLQNHRLLYQNASLVSRSLKVPLGETGGGVLALLEKANALERHVKELEEAAAETKAAALLGTAKIAASGVLVHSFATEDMEEVLRIGRAAQKQSGAVLVLASQKDCKFAAFCSDKKRDIRPLLSAAFEQAGGKGGGGSSFVQGLFASPAELAVFLAAVSKGTGA